MAPEAEDGIESCGGPRGAPEGAPRLRLPDLTRSAARRIGWPASGFCGRDELLELGGVVVEDRLDVLVAKNDSSEGVLVGQGELIALGTQSDWQQCDHALFVGAVLAGHRGLGGQVGGDVRAAEVDAVDHGEEAQRTARRRLLL